MNNAGIEKVLDIELVPIKQMKKVADVNFYGMVRITKAFLPMIRQTKGKIHIVYGEIQKTLIVSCTLIISYKLKGKSIHYL